MIIDVSKHIDRLRDYVEHRDAAGYDPYDAMNSPLLRLLSFGTKYGRIAWTQFMRRCPVNFRPLLGVSCGHNPKAVGLFLGAYSKLYKLDPSPRNRATIERLIELLQKSTSPGYSGSCWGYNFDWQSRAAYVPKFTPTIVNSAFIGHALLDAYEHTGKQEALDLAVDIEKFILNDLKRKKDGDTFCFSYTPVDENYVHNASMLGASLLLRLSKVSNDPSLVDPAMRSFAYSMKHQRDDGSWHYAETEFQRWIDSFHTGFNLQAVRYFLRAGEAAEYQEAYDRGVDYYARSFFLDDGTPKYYHDRIYPVDIHAPTQAIAFFSGEGAKYRELTDRVLAWTMANMWNDRGYFYFRKYPRFTNKIAYMRWSQAWGFHALTEYLSNQ